MFKPPSILQPDIIMEFSITTSDDIIVLSPMLTLGPIEVDSSILQFLPIIDGLHGRPFGYKILPPIVPQICF